MEWHHLWTLWNRTRAQKALLENQIHLFQSDPADLDYLGFSGKELHARVTKLRSEGIPVKDKNGVCIPGFSQTEIRDFKKFQTTFSYNLSKWEHSLFMT